MLELENILGRTAIIRLTIESLVLCPPQPLSAGRNIEQVANDGISPRPRRGTSWLRLLKDLLDDVEAKDGERDVEEVDGHRRAEGEGGDEGRKERRKNRRQVQQPPTFIVKPYSSR